MVHGTFVPDLPSFFATASADILAPARATFGSTDTWFAVYDKEESEDIEPPLNAFVEDFMGYVKYVHSFFYFELRINEFLFLVDIVIF